MENEKTKKQKFKRFKKFLARQKHATELVIENCLCRLTNVFGTPISPDTHRATVVIGDGYDKIRLRVEKKIVFIINKEGDGALIRLYDPSGEHELGTFVITDNFVHPTETITLEPPDNKEFLSDLNLN